MSYSITVNEHPLGRSIDAVFNDVKMNFQWDECRRGIPRLYVNASVNGRNMDSYGFNAANLAQNLRESFLMGVARSEANSFAEQVWQAAEKIRAYSFVH